METNATPTHLPLYFLIIILLSGCLLPGTIFSQTAPEPESHTTEAQTASLKTPPLPSASDTELSKNIINGKSFNYQIYPNGDAYPRYLADPRQPKFRTVVMHLSESEIPDAGENRFWLTAGTRFGLLHITPQQSDDRGIEISAECGLMAQFDIDDHLDNIGWDGYYGLMLAYQFNPDISFKFATQHDSSHIGDEYIEKTGRNRIEYTREEWAFGVSWIPIHHLRVYSEVGRAYKYKDFMEPYRIQAGLEITQEPRYLKNSSNWYLATDMVSWEERDWNISTSVQIGICTKSANMGRQYRWGMEFYNGRSLIGEFFQYDERYLCLGVWIDV